LSNWGHAVFVGTIVGHDGGGIVACLTSRAPRVFLILSARGTRTWPANASRGAVYALVRQPVTTAAPRVPLVALDLGFAARVASLAKLLWLLGAGVSVRNSDCVIVHVAAIAVAAAAAAAVDGGVVRLGMLALVFHGSTK